MKRLGSILLIALLTLGSAAFAEGTLICSLTGKEISSCCCEQRNGKLYCTLAKKEIKGCCCKPKK